MNGVARGTTVAVTQAVLGANPLTAGIGLVALDVVETHNQRCLSLSSSQSGAARYGPQEVVGRLMAASPLRTAWVADEGLGSDSDYPASSSHHPGPPPPSTIQRRPLFLTEYHWFLPLPIVVLT